MDKLLPCPFCGGDAVMGEFSEEDFSVICRNAKCAAFIDYRSQKDTVGFADKYTAIKAWNTRERDEVIKVLVESCKKLIMHKNQGDLHPIDYQRIEQTLAKVNPDSGEEKVN